MDNTAMPSVEDNESFLAEKPPKKRKPGIVYLSTIPPNMNVSSIREYFNRFGKIGRMYLQAAENSGQEGKKKKNKKSLHFTEGWIEFKSKRKAKQVHLFLNNQPVGGKKLNPNYDMLWNIKYLPRFKWAYLKQRLEYEREVHRQRMNIEISQVRRETDHFIKASEISKKKKKRGEKKGENKEVENQNRAKSGKIFIFKQKQTENIVEKKMDIKTKNEMYRNRIAERKKKKQEMKRKKAEITSKPEEDFLSSVFVGSAK